MHITDNIYASISRAFDKLGDWVLQPKYGHSFIVLLHFLLRYIVSLGLFVGACFTASHFLHFVIRDFSPQSTWQDAPVFIALFAAFVVWFGVLIRFGAPFFDLNFMILMYGFLGKETSKWHTEHIKSGSATTCSLSPSTPEDTRRARAVGKSISQSASKDIKRGTSSRDK